MPRHTQQHRPPAPTTPFHKNNNSSPEPTAERPSHLHTTTEPMTTTYEMAKLREAIRGPCAQYTSAEDIEIARQRRRIGWGVDRTGRGEETRKHNAK
eukprot:COSAG04_NODE_19801_length_407_cov_3.717532_1_plen_96_part_01